MHLDFSFIIAPNIAFALFALLFPCKACHLNAMRITLHRFNLFLDGACGIVAFYFEYNTYPQTSISNQLHTGHPLCRWLSNLSRNTTSPVLFQNDLLQLSAIIKKKKRCISKCTYAFIQFRSKIYHQ